MALFDYIFTVTTIVLGSVWVGIGIRLGNDIYGWYLRKRFKSWFDKYHSTGNKVLHKVAKPIINKINDKENNN